MGHFVPNAILSILVFGGLFFYYGALGTCLVRTLRVRLKTQGFLRLCITALLGFLLNAYLHFGLVSFFGVAAVTHAFHLIIGIAVLIWFGRPTFAMGKNVALAVANSVKNLSRSEKYWLAAGGTLLLLNIANVFVPQTHGDSYLYHIVVGRIWWLNGGTGVDPANVTTGYSWAVESGYSFLRMIFGEKTFHIIHCQMHHAFFGYLTTLALLQQILCRLGASFFYSMLALLVFANPAMSQMALTAKNDGIALTLVLAFAWFLWTRETRALLLISFFALSAKVTAALGLACVSLAFVAWKALQRQSVTDAVRLISGAAILTLLGLAPFLVNNYIHTGNPLFPILNNLFKSALVPQSAESIVREMAPFSVTWAQIGESLLLLLQRHPYFLLLPVIGVAIVRQRNSVHRARFLMMLGGSFVTFLLLQVALGPYQIRVEERHFKLPIYGAALALMLGATYLRASPLRRVLQYILAIAVVAQLSVEVKLRNLGEALAASSVKELFLAKKPHMRALHQLEQRAEFREGEVVLSLVAELPTSYFLVRGHYWHEAITADLLRDPALMSPDRLPQLVRSGQVHYIMIRQDQIQYRDLLAGELKGKVVSVVEPFQLYAF